MGYNIIDENIDKVITNNIEYSKAKLRCKNRSLTAGEINLAKSVYKNAIDYNKVRIIGGSFFPLDMQQKDTFVTPNGNIYIPPLHYQDDYSKSTPGNKKILLHELGHVWQHQKGILVGLNAGALQACNLLSFTIYDPYIYDLRARSSIDPRKPKQFSEYNLESQAEMISDYWALKNNVLNRFLKDNLKNINGYDRNQTLKLYEEKIGQAIK